MEQHFEFLRKHPIFESFTDEEIEQALVEFDYKIQSYKNDDIIVSSGKIPLLCLRVRLKYKNIIQTEFVKFWEEFTVTAQVGLSPPHHEPHIAILKQCRMGSRQFFFWILRKLKKMIIKRLLFSKNYLKIFLYCLRRWICALSNIKLCFQSVPYAKK